MFKCKRVFKITTPSFVHYIDTDCRINWVDIGNELNDNENKDIFYSFWGLTIRKDLIQSVQQIVEKDENGIQILCDECSKY